MVHDAGAVCLYRGGVDEELNGVSLQSGVIFWADDYYGAVRAVRSSGGECKTIAEDQERPHHLVSSSLGIVWGTTSAVMLASPRGLAAIAGGDDGPNAERVTPLGLAVRGPLVVWSDVDGSIWRADLRGTTRQRLCRTEFRVEEVGLSSSTLACVAPAEGSVSVLDVETGVELVRRRDERPELATASGESCYVSFWPKGTIRSVYPESRDVCAFGSPVQAMVASGDWLYFSIPSEGTIVAVCPTNGTMHIVRRGIDDPGAFCVEGGLIAWIETGTRSLWCAAAPPQVRK
jgi:hypothetical protein